MIAVDIQRIIQAVSCRQLYCDPFRISEEACLFVKRYGTGGDIAFIECCGGQLCIGFGSSSSKLKRRSGASVHNRVKLQNRNPDFPYIAAHFQGGRGRIVRIGNRVLADVEAACDVSDSFVTDFSGHRERHFDLNDSIVWESV